MLINCLDMCSFIYCCFIIYFLCCFECIILNNKFIFVFNILYNIYVYYIFRYCDVFELKIRGFFI